MKYAYKPGDKIITWEGQKGIIEDIQISTVDNKQIPSYWVTYDLATHPDGYARNTWESSIRCSETEKNCKNCKNDNCCFLAFICIPFNHKYFE
jgi:hypothetical protein